MPKNVLSDCEIEFSGFYSHKAYPERLQMVRYWDEDDQREFTFLTNAKHISALQVANLYKNRWQVELFFISLMDKTPLMDLFSKTKFNNVKEQSGHMYLIYLKI